MHTSLCLLRKGHVYVNVRGQLGEKKKWSQWDSIVNGKIVCVIRRPLRILRVDEKERILEITHDEEYHMRNSGEKSPVLNLSRAFEILKGNDRSFAKLPRAEPKLL